MSSSGQYYHHLDHSRGSSAASGFTVSDGITGEHGGSSMFSTQFLGPSGHPVCSDTSTHLQLQYSKEPESSHGKDIRMRTWLYARLGLRAAVLCWVVYCTIRYFIAVRIYRGDNIRSRYALGMGIASAFTIVFFASEISMILQFPDNQFYRLRRSIVYFLTCLSSALVIGLTIINLVLVNVWRRPSNPAQFDRSVQGRCHWDLDVVWSGTGMACADEEDKSFDAWLGAAITRSVASAVLMIAYHLTVHVYVNRDAQQQSSAASDADMSELGDHEPRAPIKGSRLPAPRLDVPLLVPVVMTMSEDEHQRRSLSFTAAGQVLSRIEGSELDDDDHASFISSSSEQHQRLEELLHPRRFNMDTFVSSLRSESPEALFPTESLSAPDSHMSSYLPQPGSSRNPYPGLEGLPPNPPPSMHIHNIPTPSNHLQDFASAFRNLGLHPPQEIPEGPTLGNSIRRSFTVHVLGSYISRMSTIDSIGSREAGSPVISLLSSDTNHSDGFGSKRLSMGPTATCDRDQTELLATTPPPGTGSANGHSAS